MDTAMDWIAPGGIAAWRACKDRVYAPQRGTVERAKFDPFAGTGANAAPEEIELSLSAEVMEGMEFRGRGRGTTRQATARENTIDRGGGTGMGGSGGGASRANSSVRSGRTAPGSARTSGSVSLAGSGAATPQQRSPASAGRGEGAGGRGEGSAWGHSPGAAGGRGGAAQSRQAGGTRWPQLPSGGTGERTPAEGGGAMEEGGRGDAEEGEEERAAEGMGEMRMEDADEGGEEERRAGEEAEEEPELPMVLPPGIRLTNPDLIPITDRVDLSQGIAPREMQMPTREILASLSERPLKKWWIAARTYASMEVDSMCQAIEPPEGAAVLREERPRLFKKQNVFWATVQFLLKGGMIEQERGARGLYIGMDGLMTGNEPLQSGTGSRGGGQDNRGRGMRGEGRGGRGVSTNSR